MFLRSLALTLCLAVPAGAEDLANQLFGAKAAPSLQDPMPIGSYAKGCGAGMMELPESGDTWQAMRLSRNRHYGQPDLVQFLMDLSATARDIGFGKGLYIGDMSQPRGGPMLTGHASHQVGLDADIWMLPPANLHLSAAQREKLSSVSVVNRAGTALTSAWNPGHMAIIRAAARDPRVERIFVFPGAKVEMCDNATGDRSWLSKIRLLANHNYHFHVRLACPPGDTSCVAQDPVPAGDGCDEAREAVDLILNPPPPDPNYVPPPPRGPLTMAELPGQCSAVLASN